VTDAPAEPPFAPPASPPPAAAADNAGNAAIGVLLALVMLLLQVPLGFLAIAVARLFGASSGAAPYAVFVPALFFGVSQLLYIVPTGVYLHMQRKTRTALGLWCTAGVLFLLNAACFGLLALNWR
jgi:hypothetical protein